MPAVSVVVPVRNGEARLAKALGSILDQTLTDIEVIVVDDASTDATAEIIAEFAAADSRIRGVPGPGIGSASAARNVGLDLVAGEYLAVLDSDDHFAPKLLETLYERARTDAADIVVTKFRTVDQATGEATKADWAVRLADLPQEMPFSAEQMGDHVFLAFNPAAWNKLFRTEFIRRADLRFQALRRADDLFFTYMALALAERVSVVEGYLIDYLVGNEGSLEGSLHESPLDFVRALDHLQEGLRTAGIFERFERAFVNVAAEVSLSNLNKVRTAAAFAEVHQALRTEVYRRHGVAGRAPEYFVRPQLAVQTRAVHDATTEELLFSRLQAEKAAAQRASAEARATLHEVELRANAARLAAALQPPPSPAPRDRDTAQVGGPDVSVIIPVHNTAEYLDECLDHALAQTGVELEIICIDDGSTDLSGELLDHRASQDPRITVVHQENAGQSVARNRGIELARGRYLCFLDSDDWWQRDVLAELVAKADSDGLDLLLFDATSVREAGVADDIWEAFRTYYERASYPGTHTGPELLAAMRANFQYVVSPCLYLVRGDHLRDSGVRFYPGIVHEDNLFTFELMLSADHAGHSQTQFYCRRLRPGSTMTATSRLLSAQGYLISYLEMVRLAGRTTYPEPVSSAVASVIFATFRGAYDNAARLNSSLAGRLKEVDPSPEAQALLMAFSYWRHRLRKKAGPPAPPAEKAAAPQPRRTVRWWAGKGLRQLGTRLGLPRISTGQS
jgi:glycosyltransferase involved in cell wall biosynthesis